MPNPQNKYKQKGFEEVHTLSEFVNIPGMMNRARKNELRRLGITPLNNIPPRRFLPDPVPVPTKNLTLKQKQRLEANIARSLNWNNDDNLKIFANLRVNNSRSRGSSNASDPKVNSRASSPGLKGGRKTRKQKRKQRHVKTHTRKY